MTVFGFGRSNKEKYLNTPQTFSIGFVESTEYAKVEEVKKVPIDVLSKKLTSVKHD